MSFVSYLKKQFGRYMTADGPLTSDIKLEKRYLSRFPEPRNLMERSFFQYLCQIKLMGPIHWFVNPALGILYVYKYLAIRYVQPKSAEPLKAFFCSDNDYGAIVPDELVEEFGQIPRIDHTKILSLNKEDRKFLHEIAKRYPFRWHFRFKCMLKMAMYRYVIDTYHPKALIVSSEYSFTSSMMTEYLRRNGVEHINIMHGEKLFYIRDAFVSFDRYYVWHKHYIELFKSLRADVSSMIVSLPPVLQLPAVAKDKKVFDYTFYFSNEDPETVQKVLEAIKKLDSKGYRVSVRPHPRYTRVSAEDLAGTNIRLENNKELPFEQSLCQTKSAISLYSTVLFQAYCNGVGIVIDDVSRPLLYERLKELQYIGLNIEHKKFSEILEIEQ